MTQSFDFEQALKALQTGKNQTDKEGILFPLIKQLTKAALNTEIELHLEQDAHPNRHNGISQKTIKHASGSFELDVPRNRQSTFEPQLIKKHQTTLTDEMDRQILSMFSKGMSYRDIHQHVKDMYGINVSVGTINRFSCSHSQYFSSSRGSVMRDSSNPQLDEICGIKASKSLYG